jgi:hypothetical protein
MTRRISTTTSTRSVSSRAAVTPPLVVVVAAEQQHSLCVYRCVTGDEAFEVIASLEEQILNEQSGAHHMH